MMGACKVTDSKNSLAFKLIGILALAICLLVAFRTGQDKLGYHVDEYYSYGLANSYYKPFPDDYNQWLSPDYYADYLTTSEEDRFSYGSVYYKQTQDVHPPFYYMVLHTVSSFFPGSFSKWLGLGLNLVVYALILLVLYFFLRELLANRWLALAFATFYGLSLGGLSSFVYIRMYLLLALIQVVFAYVAYKYLKTPSRKFLLAAMATTLLGGLTQYYYYIFAGILTAVLFVLLCLQKEVKAASRFALGQALSVLACIAIFPSTINHLLNSGRGNEVVGNLFGTQQVDQLRAFYDLIMDQLFAGYGKALLAFAILAFLVLCWQRKALDSFLLLALPTVLGVALIALVSPYPSARYIFAFYPLIIACAGLLYQQVLAPIPDFDWAKLALLVCFLGGLTYMGHREYEVDYLYPESADFMHIVKANNQSPVIVIPQASEPQRIVWHTEELIQFPAIYPIEARQGDYREKIQQMTHGPVEDEVTLLIHRDVLNQHPEVLKALYDKFGFSENTWLGRNRHFELYRLH